MIELPPQLPLYIDAGVLKEPDSVPFVVYIINSYHMSKATLFDNLIKELTTDRGLRDLRADIDVETHESAYLKDRIVGEFPRVVFADQPAGLGLQKLYKHIIRTKPNRPVLAGTFGPMTKIFKLLYPNTKSRAKILRDLREVITKTYGVSSPLNAEAKMKLNITRAESNEQKALEESRLLERNNSKQNYNVDNIMGTIRRLQASSKFEDECILVALSTGSRMVEILRESEYLPVKNNPNKIKIIGLAKKKTKNGEVVEEKVSIIKPIIYLRSDELIAKINDLRKLSLDGDGEEITNQKLTARFVTRLNRRLRELDIKDEVNKKEAMKFHNLRRIYARLSYEQFADKKRVSFNAWTKDVLGHEFLKTSLNYANVEIAKDQRPTKIQVAEVKAEVKELEDRVAQVEKPATFPDNIDPAKVEFKTKDGNVFYIKKLENRKLDREQQMYRIEQVVAELVLRGLRPTIRRLKMLGVGSTYATQYMDAWRERGAI